MNELLEKIYNDKEFINVIDDMINNKTVQEMKKYRQHYETSCFDHCLEASYFCYKICKKLHLDYISCARAAMVHDLFYMIGVFVNLVEKVYMLLHIQNMHMKMLAKFLI